MKAMFNIWKALLKKHNKHEIVLCKEWTCFDNFLSDMGARPEGMLLRCFGDVWNKENCQFVTFESMYGCDYEHQLSFNF